MGFEPTPVFTDQNTPMISLYFKLESGALDRSATLTSYSFLILFLYFKKIKKSFNRHNQREFQPNEISIGKLSERQVFQLKIILIRPQSHPEVNLEKKFKTLSFLKIYRLKIRLELFERKRWLQNRQLKR